MADRVELIGAIGNLVTEARARGDMKTAAILRDALDELSKAHAEWCRQDDKKARDRSRKPRNSANSTEQLEFRAPPSSPSFPTPLLTTPSPVVPVADLTPSEQTNSGRVVGTIAPPPDTPTLTLEESLDANAYALGLTTAANRGITAKFGEQPTPYVWSNTYTLGLAEELVRLKVPLEFARSAIVDGCGKLREKPRGVNYFRPVILAAFNASEQRVLDRASSAPAALSRPGPVSAGTAAARQYYDSGKAAELEREREGYDIERRAAGDRWADQVATAAELAAIRAGASKDMANVPSVGLRERAIAGAVSLSCSRAAGFPAFEEWQKAKPHKSGTGTG